MLNTSGNQTFSYGTKAEIALSQSHNLQQGTEVYSTDISLFTLVSQSKILVSITFFFSVDFSYPSIQLHIYGLSYPSF